MSEIRLKCLLREAILLLEDRNAQNPTPTLTQWIKEAREASTLGERKTDPFDEEEEDEEDEMAEWCDECQGRGKVTTADYESYFGACYKPCPKCAGDLCLGEPPIS